MILGVIGTIIFGAIIGMLARAVLPGRQSISAPITVILGIIGAVVGYWLMPENTNGVDWLRWVVSIAAAAALTVGYGMVTGNKQVHR